MRVLIFKGMGLLGVYSRISRNLKNPTKWPEIDVLKTSFPTFWGSTRKFPGPFSDWRVNLRGWGTSVRSTPRKSKRRSIRRPWMSPSFGAQDPIMAIVGDPRIQAPNPPSETTKPLNNWWKQLLCAVSCCRWREHYKKSWLKLKPSILPGNCPIRL